MKLVFLFGNCAVGKMTVGQELMKITDLRLFHNHMTIEPVLEVFGRYQLDTVKKLRDVYFHDFAASDLYGMIFTFMMAFDLPSEWEYIDHVKSIFAPYGTEFYYVELVAPQSIRLERNKTENRLRNKASKRDIALSESLLLKDDARYRMESLEGEIPFENYLRIDNSTLSPEAVAQQIKEYFDL